MAMAVPPASFQLELVLLKEASGPTDRAGTHRELIHVAYSDFERLVQPVVVRVAAAAAR